MLQSLFYMNTSFLFQIKGEPFLYFYSKVNFPFWEYVPLKKDVSSQKMIKKFAGLTAMLVFLREFQRLILVLWNVQ